MGKKTAAEGAARVALGRQHASTRSKIPNRPRSPVKRNLASRLADKAGIGLYVNIAQSLPGLLELLTPTKLHQTIKRSADGGGFILADHKYIGPGNAMDLGWPVDDGDALAYLHDEAYARLLDSGLPPAVVYAGSTQADEDAIADSEAILSNHPDVGALAVLLGISAKHKAAKRIQQLLSKVPSALLNKLHIADLAKFYPDVETPKS